jgi:hypothetical protein
MPDGGVFLAPWNYGGTMRWESVRSTLRDKPEIGVAISSGGAGIFLAVLLIFDITGIKPLLAVTQLTLASLSWSIFRDQLADRSKPTIYDSQEIPYQELIKDIRQHGAKKAVFVQYSCTESADVLEAVLQVAGAKAIVYLQDEHTAASIGCQRQVTRITGSILGTLSEWRRKYQGHSTLEVYKCTMPMSVRGIMIDDRLLCMGGYTYEPDDREGATDHLDDTVAVSGHDTATMIARRGTREFDALNATFSMLVDKYERFSREPWIRQALTSARP